MLIAPDGGGDSTAMGQWFSVQVTSLEAYQKQLSTMLQDTETQLTKVNTTDGSGSFGTFSEATTLYASYEATKQDIIAQFQEVSQLIDAMVTSLGTNASNYTAAEAQIQSQFNQILTSYGDTTTTTSTTVATPNSSGSTSSTAMGNM